MTERNTLALEAATFAQVLSFNLLGMSSKLAKPDERQTAARKAFSAWAVLCRRMGELEPLCPSSAAAGYADDEMLRIDEMLRAVAERASQ